MRGGAGVAGKGSKKRKPPEEHKPSGGARPGAGRPPAEIDRAVLAKLAQIHCTVPEAAAFMRISRQTLANRLETDAELREIWESGRETGKASLRRLLWRKAQEPGSSGFNAARHLAMFWLGEVESKLRPGNGDDAPDDPRETAKKIKAALDEIEQSVEGPSATTEKKGTS